MPSEKQSIYIGESLSRVTRALAVHLGGLTGAVNAIADRYTELLRRERPTLTLDEWCAVCEANNGVWMDAFSHEVPTLQLLGELEAAEETPDWMPAVEPQIVAGDPALTWEVDAARVNDILRGLSFGARLAVLDVVEHVWADERTNVRAALQEILS